MNFNWTEEQAALRQRLRDLLARELPPDWEAISRHGPGSPEQTAFSLAFCPKLAAEGLLVPHWPPEYGGRGAPAWEHFIVGEELFAAGEPRGPQYMNVNFIGATLMKYGTPAQQQRYLPDMAAGRSIWCQGFSEPSAGSDLAALATRAIRQGDDYVINGCKVWTSYAGMAQTCFLLARTGTGKGGIAIFLVPMDSRGIRVRAIPSLIGHGDIHEVFFDDVVVTATQRLGEEGQAWAIISYALSLERVGLARYAFSRRVLDSMVCQLQAQGRFAGELVRAQAGQALAACEAARLLVYRVVDQRARSLPPTAESNLARVAVVAADHAVSNFALDHFGHALCGDHWPLVLAHHERAIAAGIAAGAAEIQLNLVAQEWLQLPREPRMERGVNFAFNPDQQALLDAVDKIAQRHQGHAVLGASLHEYSRSLQEDLDGAGVFQAAAIAELGPVAAIAMVHRLAQLPQCVELPAASLLLPLLAPSLRGPCAVLWGNGSGPARWLPVARTVIRVHGDRVACAALQDGDSAPLDSPFGYPVGKLESPDGLAWQALPVPADDIRRWWRVGMAAELAGCMDAGLQAVVAHVRDRRQFGRPLGAFQAIQHRLAQVAVGVEASRWLALQAAHSGTAADAAMAAGYAQQCSDRGVYDLHQFMGAMGLTLEHPLHRWSTRAKMLRADLGGSQAQFVALADTLWCQTSESTV